VENEDNPGTGVCTEFYDEGLAQAVCGEMATDEACPRENLYGVCVAGFSTYEYAETKEGGDQFYAASKGSCEAQGATWCGPG
jgi:hypothetical protein